MTPPAYPADLETWWLRRLQAVSGLKEPRKSLPWIEPHIRALSDSFTRRRDEAFQDSYATAEARAAYGVFFFPQTYARVTAVLDELASSHGWVPPDSSTRRILDLGAGLGAASLAAARHPLLAAPRMETTAVESVPANYELQQRLFREILPHEVRVLGHTGDMREITLWAPRRTHRWDLILCALSLNEAFPDGDTGSATAWLNEVSAHLTPGGLLVILEPALHGTARRLAAVRDRLLTNNSLHVWAPCLHRHACPAVGHGFVCHEARRWVPPDSLKLLNRSLHREIETLKFSFLVLGRTPPPRPTTGPEHLRLVSPVSKQPGRLLFHGCAADGGVHRYDLLARHLDKDAKEAWWACERGSLLYVSGLQPLGTPGEYRIPPGLTPPALAANCPS